jgi:uncharacterized protein (TIGR02453 family)
MASKFPGFPNDLFVFLKELAANNNREWFTENKPRYRASIVEPMCDFIEAMGDRLPKISDCFVADTRTNGGSMFRIYRDTRFSKDKRPYKQNVGCQFRHMAGKDAHAPGFYVHLEPDNVFVGGGIWQPPSQILGKIRTMIVENPAEWKRITSNKKIIERMGGIAGDGLKRPPRGYDPNHPFIEDLKRKSIYAFQNIDSSVVTAPDFIDEVGEAFTTISPLMRFITEALELPYYYKESLVEA